jgi:hypothetical protein
MAKPTNQATFSTGAVITRNGKITYTHAWLSSASHPKLTGKSGGDWAKSGFAPSKEAAEAAAQSFANFCTKNGMTLNPHSEVVAVD